METVIDHIVVVAPNLAAGATLVSDALGVKLQQGGVHPRMATHNLLLRLGDSTYLEVISPDSSAAKPSHPRWFALDCLAPDDPPKLAAWVVRTEDIYFSRSMCASVLGNIEPMSRGALSWLITVPSDGSLPLGGAAPVLIEWQSKPHPAYALNDLGCSLHHLEIFHPEPEQVQVALKSLNLSTPVSIHQLSTSSQPKLVAQIQTPCGLCTL
jgi:hypothetical protein